MRDLTCVSIALWEGENPILGVIYRYQNNELFEGMSGTGAKMNGDTIKTSGSKSMQESVLATGFPLKRDYGTDSLAQFIQNVQNFKKIRMLGAAALMGAYVAVGRVDAYTEDGIMFWDIAAATAIVAAAGGVIMTQCKCDDQYICELFANEYLYEDYNKMKRRASM